MTLSFIYYIDLIQIRALLEFQIYMLWLDWNYDILILGSTIEDYFSEFGTTGSAAPGNYEYDTSASHFETEEFEYRTENYDDNNKAYDSNNE